MSDKPEYNYVERYFQGNDYDPSQLRGTKMTVEQVKKAIEAVGSSITPTHIHISPAGRAFAQKICDELNKQKGINMRKQTKTQDKPNPNPATITEVSYRQTFNTGNYTSETIEFTANCNGESHLKVLDYLRRSVFFASKAAKALTKEASAVMNSDCSQSYGKLAWAEAVLEKRESRSWNECREEYQ